MVVTPTATVARAHLFTALGLFALVVDAHRRRCIFDPSVSASALDGVAVVCF